MTDNKCAQCDKDLDTDNDPYIYIEDHVPLEEQGCHEFYDKTFCSWECVKIWVSGK